MENGNRAKRQACVLCLAQAAQSDALTGQVLVHRISRSLWVSRLNRRKNGQMFFQ